MSWEVLVATGRALVAPQYRLLPDHLLEELIGDAVEAGPGCLLNALCVGPGPFVALDILAGILQVAGVDVADGVLDRAPVLLP